MSHSPRSLFNGPAGSTAWYPPVQMGVGTVARAAQRPAVTSDVLAVLRALTPDPYLEFLIDYLSAGVEKFGEDWEYLDIMNVLLASSRLIQPRRYLEIGVRRGRSLSLVARGCPGVDITGFDLWVKNYAGIDNPGTDFVRQELARMGHTGSLELISGNSHETVPEYFRKNPGVRFDLITVDGDHTDRGALADLACVIPHLSVGGILVFDDIAHPHHPGLAAVWRKALGKAQGRFATEEYTALGYGIAFAIRLE